MRELLKQCCVTCLDKLASKFVGNMPRNTGSDREWVEGHAVATRKPMARDLASIAALCIFSELSTLKRCPGGCGGDMGDVAGERRA